MDVKISVGDCVKLISLPDWLVHDLPDDEKIELRACIGRLTTVEDIDAYGYYWVGFGSTIEDGDTAYYSGHSFCVPPECLHRQ